MLKNDGSHERKTDGPEKLGKFVYSTPAIQTLYNGVEFRSRLEAKWAAFFDYLGWFWNYEPVDLDGWIPDFELGHKGLLVEVKPFRSLDEFNETSLKINAATKDRQADIAILGVDPRFMWLSDYFTFIDGHGWDWSWDVATIGPVGGVGNVLSVETGDYRDRITGVYDGDHYWPGEKCDYENATLITNAWNFACNATKWRKRNDAR